MTHGIAENQPREEPDSSIIRTIRHRLRDTSAALQRTLPLLAEIAIILCWTFVITAPYVQSKFNEHPVGGEYYAAITTHTIWNNMNACGPCVFWNGGLRGGAPAFADTYGSMLHPLVIVTTLVFGVLPGAKIALVMIFMLGGFAQWWLAYVLQLGRVGRRLERDARGCRREHRWAARKR